MRLRRTILPDLQWKTAGAVAVVLSIAVLAWAFGIAVTRPAEPLLVDCAEPLALEKSGKIVVIGDSYTAGTRMGGMRANNWVQRTWCQLQAEGVDVTFTVSGRGGSGYVTPGAVGTTFGQEVGRLVEPDDDVVLVFGGSNDMAVKADSLAAAVHGTLSDVRSRAPNAKLIVVGPVWPETDHPIPEILQIRDILAREAATENATFVDPIADGWFADDPRLIGQDGVHPTDAGHQYMADRLLPVIRSLVQAPVGPGG